jgi:pimeloyl-ACP methyl ester carboxylesterase
MNVKSKLFSVPMIVALALILGGGFFAFLVQTSGGDIEVRDVRFMGSTYVGNPGAPPLEVPVHVMMSALLYIPEGVSAKNKAPGVVAVHGYYNSRETQDGFAIEFARRGYVVLAIDQPGHGYSDPPAFANAFGGIDALKYLRSLDFVDPDNIALEGHSMGGWSIAFAALIPNGYKSFICASSATGLPMFGVPEGTATYPRNFALIYSLYDEFSGMFWGAPIPKDIVNSDKLKKQFGTTETIEVGKLYGSIEDGTARKLYMPSMIHPRVHFSKEAIDNAVEWLQATLKGGNTIPPSDQTWYWKEIFTFLALIGMVILIISLGGYLLNTEYFQDLKGDPPQQKSLTSWGWWIGAVVMIILPLPFYKFFWTKHLVPGALQARFIWPEQITNIIMFWAVTVGAISLILFLLWHFIFNKKQGATAADYGAPWVIKIRAKSLLLAFIVIFVAHLSVAISGWLFDTDFRLWVLAIKPLNALRFGITLGYIIPFLFYFCVLGIILHGQMRPGKPGSTLGMGKEMIINILLLIIGPIFLALIQYIPLFAGGTLTWPGFNLGGIFLFQVIAIFTIVGIIMTYFYRKTGRIFVGSYISAMFVTWVIVASQVIHYAY